MRDRQGVLRIGGRSVRINGVGQANGQWARLKPRLSCGHESSPFPAFRRFVLSPAGERPDPKRGVVPTPLTASANYTIAVGECAELIIGCAEFWSASLLLLCQRLSCIWLRRLVAEVLPRNMQSH